AVEGLVEHDHRGPSGGGARDLDRVLYRLRARVHEQRPLHVRARRALVQRLADFEVARIRRDLEAGVQESVRLLGDRFDDCGVTVAHIDDGNTGTQIDEPVAVDVFDDRALGVGDEDRQRRADRGRYRPRAALPQLTRLRTGYRGAHATALFHRS